MVIEHLLSTNERGMPLNNIPKSKSQQVFLKRIEFANEDC